MPGHPPGPAWLSRVDLIALRRYAIRNRVRVWFQVQPAGECMVDEQGILKIPALKGAPDYNLANLLGTVEQFIVETRGNPPKRQKLSRQELEGRLGEGPAGEAAEE